ncbi:hypothetical protein DL89DRAFT_154512 [Linderina pennispora]|uniref:Uncharacterized protein n=1 Tax=Linderina pennispora TaxID=61395 RepID=A0A1Y1W9P6_9FUNG|nr:uncharacterized protein DL89DRAFT_154512 [Linderina pennispora]ORX70243.1 hypothetical protein DL89DRAFT_154512 [Linderina pennispora]
MDVALAASVRLHSAAALQARMESRLVSNQRKQSRAAHYKPETTDIRHTSRDEASGLRCTYWADMEQVRGHMGMNADVRTTASSRRPLLHYHIFLVSDVPACHVDSWRRHT